MATDYSKRKNAELEDLLKARSLPHTGKKADLVARLQQYDKEHSSSTATPAAAATEDEIDWEDDTVPSTTTTTAPPPTATSQSSAAALAAGGTGPVDTPLAVPNQVSAEDPSTSNDLTVQVPTSTPAPAPAPAADPTPAPDFSVGLSTTTLSSELAKRQKRAARFGLADASSNNINKDDEATKALERAKRFGTSAAADGADEGVKGLDKALPERGPRKRGRGMEEEEGGRGGKRREGRRNGGGGAGARRNGGGERRNGGLGEKDRVAAEARKKRFAGAT